MIKFSSELYTAEDIIGDDLGDYHKAWKTWVERNREKEKKEIVQCSRNERVVLGKIFVYGNYDGKSAGLKRGEVCLARSMIFQDDLRREINPYVFGKEKKYLYPFWHEYHIWQAGEQMTHGLRNKLSLEGGKENYGLIVTPKSAFDIHSHIFFHENVSVEIIWHKVKDMSRNGNRLSIENFYISFYNEENKALARASAMGFTQPRKWITLADKVREGDVKAREDLCNILLIQRKYLDKIGRVPTTKTKELMDEIKGGVANNDKLKDFFSMW